MFNNKRIKKLEADMEYANAILDHVLDVLMQLAPPKKRGRQTNATRYGLKKDSTPKKKPGRKKIKK